MAFDKDVLKPPRCGRCRWWQGHRLYGDGSQTVAIAMEGLCANPTPGLANQVFYFLSGAECPGFERNEPNPASTTGESTSITASPAAQAGDRAKS